VIVLSIVMAIFVGRGVQGSVTSLAVAATHVRTSRDYSVRALQVSHDELGMLTETFNEMLSGIQSRDAELEQHRSHLEGLVVARTQELAARNGSMRLVLDTVDQGLATIGLDGALHPERSRAFDDWFGTVGASKPFYDALAPTDDRLRSLFRLGWEQVVADELPIEVSLAQMPRRFDRGERHLTLAMKPTLQDGVLTGALLLVSDVTTELEARMEQARQREEIQVFRRIARDKAAFLAFLDETGSIVERLRDDAQLAAAEQLGLVHTLKGNAAQCEVRSVADVAHELESSLVEARAPLTKSELAPLFRAWDLLVEQVRALGQGGSWLEVSRTELEQLIELTKRGLPQAELVARLDMLFDEPLAARFQRLGEHAERLATRLGKPVPTIRIEDNGLRLPHDGHSAFWAGLVHVVRNAVDHGFEGANARCAAGKPPNGTLRFQARFEKAGIVIEIADDGAGIDWKRVAEKAQRAGLSTSPTDLHQLIFSAGVSTRDAVTETSGRGVGLSAVRDAITKLGGTVVVESRPGNGTTVMFRIPRSDRPITSPR
jgi:two-component system chemotaxis sensor kinase CheA